LKLISHLSSPEVRSQINELKNVVLKEEDVTGGLIEEVWHKAGHRSFLNKLRDLDDITIPVYHPSYETGLIISMNILTQLEELPVKLLKKKSVAGDESFLTFRKSIQKNHISFLKQHDSVLITDISEVITEKSGNIIEKQSVLVQIPQARFKEEWTWDFDLKDSDYYSKKSIFKVSAILL
jgi:hypothetical protein